jgi:hypothetical protein
LSTTNLTWIDPGANPGLRGERPATNDLSHDTALSLLLVWHALRMTFSVLPFIIIFIRSTPSMISVLV